MITAMLKPAYDAFYRSFLQVRIALSVPCRRLDKKVEIHTSSRRDLANTEPSMLTLPPHRIVLAAG